MVPGAVTPHGQPDVLWFVTLRRLLTFHSLIGEIILAADVSQITYRTIRDYNTIARGNDKLCRQY